MEAAAQHDFLMRLAGRRQQHGMVSTMQEGEGSFQALEPAHGPGVTPAGLEMLEGPFHKDSNECWKTGEVAGQMSLSCIHLERRQRGAWVPSQSTHVL